MGALSSSTTGKHDTKNHARILTSAHIRINATAPAKSESEDGLSDLQVCNPHPHSRTSTHGWFHRLTLGWYADCRVRKIKCDEGKPACRRCSSTGRICAGYDHTPGQAATIFLYRPRQLTARDEKERRSLHFFSRKVGPVLAGPMDGYFWTHLVMQFSHFTPAARHAVIAISSLYEDFVGGSPIVGPMRNLFALEHYNAAIREVCSQDGQQVLVLCILFVCVELLQGDLGAAKRHCQHGIAILEELKGGSGERPPCSWVFQLLSPIFCRLSLCLFFPTGRPNVGAALPPRRLASLENGSPDILRCMPDRFDTVVEASNSLDQLLAECASVSHVQDEESTRGQHYDRTQLRGALRMWSVRISDFESRCMTLLKPADGAALCNIRMKCEREKIILVVGMGPKPLAKELEYDQHLHSFKSMVDWARRASQFVTSQVLDQPENAQRPAFSFEMGFLPLLFFVVLRCRHLETRLGALSWMPHLSAAKESLIDLGTLYRVGRRVIEIEHGISLDDELRVCNSEVGWDNGELASEERRIVAAPIDHDVEIVAGDDGMTSFRRTVRFLMPDPNGNMSCRREYLGDCRLRQFDMEIPGMRRAR
ncbi:uncharacterized protein MKZ38_007798 [Zalerion maritima]|uniref:Zn(2)-C6 fungal-type domain-containing protein n=1 Tax=Zalerion maritima TaxID=339359 RepID=A0AAD5RIA2_9PEZI|nr:uncharacterized protein MKZ38_007798 [Zalerion maritima]